MVQNIIENWQVLKLEELIEYVIGGDWGKDVSFQNENYNHVYCIRGSEIKNWNEDKGKTASLRKVSITSIDKRKLKEGDILVEISGGGPDQPVGRTVLIDKEVLNFEPNVPKICTNFFRLIRLIQGVNPQFVNQYLKFFYTSGKITCFQGGSNNLRNLKFPNFIKIKVPIPPIYEQQSIVSKIEELFSEIENGKQHLQIAQQQLKDYRQSLLKWAFEGKLTNKNVKEGELPEGWKWVKNKDLLKYVTSGSRDWKKYYSIKGSRFVRTQDINSNKLVIENSAFVDLPEKVEGKRSLIEQGDILMTITGANVGKVAVVDFPIKESYVSQSVALLKYIDKSITKYLWFYFQAQGFGKSFINKLVYGVGRPVLSLENMRQVDVLICPKEDQEQIIEELESKLSVCDKIEETISQSLLQAETLRQSILKKAFEGRLV